jgi:hypothetical protein
MAPPIVKTNTGSRPPTNEIGAVLNGAFTPASMAPWTTFVDVDEYVPELIWPNSVRTFERMRSDSQISALYHATVLAIRRFDWYIDPNGADRAMVEKIADDYNLPVLGDPPKNRRRTKNRFAFDEHLRKAMKAGIYGHYYFEQVGDISPEDRLWHLRKLAERPPRTIQEFKIASDGGLVSIVQNVTAGTTWASVPEIPVDRLVGYVWDQEGSNWVGRSWLRDVYKNWVIKDRLTRIDAVNHERAGGVPYIEAHPGATFDEIKQLNEMAKSFRIGDTSGGAVPAGAKLNVARGTNSTVVDSMKYHDEAMARRFMLMVMQLGQTQTGSRALGSTFIDFWAHGLSAIATWFADTFNEHVIEDDVDWNWGEQVDQVPRLDFEYDPEFVPLDFVNMVKSGAIIMDDELEEYVRDEMGLPAMDKSTSRKPLPVEVAAVPKTQIQETATPNEPGSTSQSGDGIAASVGEDRVLPPSDPADALSEEE